MPLLLFSQNAGTDGDFRPCPVQYVERLLRLVCQVWDRRSAFHLVRSQIFPFCSSVNESNYLLSTHQSTICRVSHKRSFDFKLLPIVSDVQFLVPFWSRLSNEDTINTRDHKQNILDAFLIILQKWIKMETIHQQKKIWPSKTSYHQFPNARRCPCKQLTLRVFIHCGSISNQTMTSIA